MNEYIEAQVTNMITIARTFEQSCKMAAIKNDGQIDKYETKQLKIINTAVQNFIRELNKLK